jgi:hypothetical protein
MVLFGFCSVVFFGAALAGAVLVVDGGGFSGFEDFAGRGDFVSFRREDDALDDFFALDFYQWFFAEIEGGGAQRTGEDAGGLIVDGAFGECMQDEMEVVLDGSPVLGEDDGEDAAGSSGSAVDAGEEGVALVVVSAAELAAEGGGFAGGASVEDVTA